MARLDSGASGQGDPSLPGAGIQAPRGAGQDSGLEGPAFAPDDDSLGDPATRLLELREFLVLSLLVVLSMVATLAISRYGVAAESPSAAPGSCRLSGGVGSVS